MRLVRTLSLTLAVAGCGTAGPPPAVDDPDAYACHDRPVSLDALQRARPATELSATGREALRADEGDVGRAAAWTVLEDTPERVTLIRRSPVPGRYPDGAVDTHDLLGFTYASGWSLTVFTSCELRKVTPGLGTAVTRLDAAYPRPTARTTAIHLLVTEEACADGLPASGRVRLVSLEQDGDRVGLHLAVAPEELAVGAARTCPGNLPTPYAIELGAPLGERPLVDVGVYPARRLR